MKKESQKKEKKKDLLIYGSEIMVPLTLTIAGVTTIVIWNLPFVTEIILGGGTIASGFQTINSTGLFYKDIKKVLKN